MAKGRDVCVTCPNRERGICSALVAASETNGGAQPSAGGLRSARRGEQIIGRDHICDEVLVLCEGWAFHFLALPDGRRQIVRFLLPGDLLSPTLAARDRSDVSTTALTDVRLNSFRREDINEALRTDPRLAHAFHEILANSLREAGALAAVLGHCSAEERIAHLILHLARRIAAANVIRSERYHIPLRQRHIADALGLTPVHVSRIIKQLQDQGLIGFSTGILEIRNRLELERIGRCL